MAVKTAFKILIIVLVIISALFGVFTYLSTHSLVITMGTFAGFFFFTAGIYLLLCPFLSEKNSSKEDC